MKTKIELVCPKCGAHLSVDANREFLFCEYCGVKILLNDENTYTIRKIDEAKIKKVEADQIIRLKELELAQRKADNEAKKLKLKIIISLVLAVIGALSMIIGDIVGPESALDDLSFIGYFALMAVLYIWLLPLAKNANEDNK